MNSYTYSGFLQSLRRSKAETLQPNYNEDELINILGFSKAIGMLTAFQISLMAGNVELASELLTKSRIELKQP